MRSLIGGNGARGIGSAVLCAFILLSPAGCGTGLSTNPEPMRKGPGAPRVQLEVERADTPIVKDVRPYGVYLEKLAQDQYHMGDQVQLRVLVTVPSSESRAPQPVSVQVKHGKVIAGELFLDLDEGGDNGTGKFTYRGAWEIPSELRFGAYTAQAFLPGLMEGSDASQTKKRTSSESTWVRSESRRFNIRAKDSKR